jgi:hypothetical protein
MAEYNSITDVATQIKEKLCINADRKSIALLYAFNAVGKTRLSVEFDMLNDNENGEIKVLSYNAFLEDLFVWDNESFILKFDHQDWRIELVKDQGLENEIVDNFKTLTNSRIEPSFDFEAGGVSFSIMSGDTDSIDNIKISKSEESLLIWSIFYSILEIVIEALNTENVENRTTDKFNHLEYIVIDDSVSSIDDTRIITMAIKLFETIESSQNKNVNFLITTHHALFYNILFNSFSRIRKADAKKHFYILSKNNNTLELKGQDNDSPFSYHLLVKKTLKSIIDSGNIEKYHFNLLRGLLEKTASFLGYGNFSDCISGDKRTELKRILNIHSHGKLSELEYNNVSDEDKVLFKEAFNEFIENFKYN